jgi:cytochrome P450
MATQNNQELPKGYVFAKPIVVIDPDLTFVAGSEEGAIPEAQLPFHQLLIALIDQGLLEKTYRRIIHTAADRKYPLVKMRFLGLTLVFPTTPQAATQILKFNGLHLRRHSLYHYASLMLGKGAVVLSDGQDWMKVRKIANKHLKHNRMVEEYSQHAEETVQELDSLLQQIATEQTVIDAFHLTSELTIEFLMRGLFGTGATSDQNEQLPLAVRQALQVYITEIAHDEKDRMRHAVDRAMEQIALSMSLGVAKVFVQGSYNRARDELAFVSSSLWIRRLFELWAEQILKLPPDSQMLQTQIDNFVTVVNQCMDTYRRHDLAGFEPIITACKENYVRITEELLRINKAEAETISKNDLLSSLVLSNIERYRLEQTPGADQEEIKEYLGNPEMVSNITAFIIGGFETVSSVLGNTLAHLAQHPEVLKKVQEELMSVYGQIKLPTMDKTPELHYMRKVLLESMRLTPPVPSTYHQVVDTFTVGIEDQNYVIPKNAAVILCARGVNLSALNYPSQDNKEVFNPSLWNQKGMGDFDPARDHHNQTEAEDIVIRSFNEGRHRCAAEFLALEYEMPFLLAYFLLNFEPEMVGEHVLKVTMSLAPIGTKLRLHRRA